jgi:hypothetical protein
MMVTSLRLLAADGDIPDVAVLGGLSRAEGLDDHDKGAIRTANAATCVLDRGVDARARTVKHEAHE